MDLEGIELRIGKGVVERAIRRFVDIEDIDVEFLGSTLRLVMRIKALFIKVPVSIALVFMEGQNTPEDPVKFELQASSMVKSFMRDFKGKAIVIDGSDVLIYPSKIFSFMKYLVVEKVSFEEDHVSVLMRPHDL